MAKGWSDAARKASAEARKGSSSPSFVDYSKAKLGDNWTFAKATANNKTRLTGATFVKPSAFEAVKKSYAKEHPQAAEAHFGKLGVQQMNLPKTKK